MFIYTLDVNLGFMYEKSKTSPHQESTVTPAENA